MLAQKRADFPYCGKLREVHDEVTQARRIVTDDGGGERGELLVRQLHPRLDRLRISGLGEPLGHRSRTRLHEELAAAQIEGGVAGEPDPADEVNESRALDVLVAEGGWHGEIVTARILAWVPWPDAKRFNSVS